MGVKLSLIALLSFIAFNCHHINGQNTADVVNSRVERTIDISTQLVRITSKVVVDNSKNKNRLDQYLVTLDEPNAQNLAYISATIDKKSVKVVRVDEKTYRLELSSSEAIAAGTASSPVIEIETIFTHSLKPFPEEIVQSERQLVQYFGNVYLTSPYLTKTQTTKVKLTPSGSIESYTKLKPTTQTDRSISYGPYENVAANSHAELKIHYENNSPFLTVTKLERVIEVSHWSGMVSIEETIDVVHTGAQLKGPFSRYEFQREPTNGISSVKSWKTKLPLAARDIYYRDHIGNISTSNLKATSQKLVADLRPRFPLFGGWKTHYVLGYYIPTQDILFNEGSDYVLKIPFIDHIFDNFVVNEAVVKVILPEGATNINYRSAYSVDRLKDQKHYTYLDTIGRTVLVFHKNNLVEQHIQDLEVHYNYQRILMLQEPLLVVSALFALCLLVMVYVRLDFSISKDAQKQASGKVSAVSDQSLRQQQQKKPSVTPSQQSSKKLK